MSYNGLYTISFDRKSSLASVDVLGFDVSVGNSTTVLRATLGPQSVGLGLVDQNKPNSLQAWSIRLIDNVDTNLYTIQNAYTGAYLMPQADSGTFTYGTDPFKWLITNDKKIQTTTTPVMTWVTSSDFKSVNLQSGGDPKAAWDIQPIVG